MKIFTYFLSGAVLALACSACADDNRDHTVQPPLKPGQTLDPDSMYAKRWPGKPALVKLNEQLILAIPPQFHKFWAHRDPLTGRDSSIRPPFPIEKLNTAKSAGFTMHMPDFEGYRPDNYLMDFDQNRVEVVQISGVSMKAMEPDAPGAYPPNIFKRVSVGQFRSFDPEKYEEKYNLRCYEKLDKDAEKQYCYGKREKWPRKSERHFRWKLRA